jgi:Glycosyltransferase family 9 (heptosyltransferase)
VSVVPLFVGGGIGDFIIALPLLQKFYELCDDYHPLRVYTPHVEIAKHFLPHFDDIRSSSAFALENDRLNWWIEIADIVHFKLRPNVAKLPDAIDPHYRLWLSVLDTWGPLIGNHPYWGNMTGNQAVEAGFNRFTLAAGLLGLTTEPFAYLCKYAKHPRPFITIHDGFDGQKAHVGRSTKQWSMEHWERFVQIFKAENPHVDVIQLGGPKSRLIPGVDLQLTNKLPFPVTMQYLNASQAHVDGDSGLVHARALLKKPSVVLFGPTNWAYFAHPRNVNIMPKVCGNCWWTTKDWLEVCAVGQPTPICMDSIRPETVLRHVQGLLGFTSAGVGRDASP